MCKKMKKSWLLLIPAFALVFASCGPSAEEQEKAKQEILQMETAQQEVDSTKKEVTKTASELDSLLNQLNAN
jgi:peptidoglycan hydrolase CwlO-like protein